MSVTDAPSLEATHRERRRKVVEAGLVERRDKVWVLRKDIASSSPSAAARLLLGRTSNGLQEWKLEGGTPLGELKPKK